MSVIKYPKRHHMFHLEDFRNVHSGNNFFRFNSFGLVRQFFIKTDYVLVILAYNVKEKETVNCIHFEII